jgi:hypothetical protein
MINTKNIAIDKYPERESLFPPRRKKKKPNPKTYPQALILP